MVLTQGDPEGVGPELLLQIAAEGRLQAGDAVFADPARLQALAASLPTPWARAGWANLEPLLAPEVSPGLGQFAALRLGVDRVLATPGAALVTAPIDKARCQQEGLPTPGHTEYLAQRAGVSEFAMAMVGPVLRVVLATIHVPLARVPEVLSPGGIVTVGCLFARFLRDDLGFQRPKIGVLGLNPHAGEGGLLGDEESRIIAPALATLRAQVPEATFDGPLSADGAFARHAQGAWHGLVAMYHDQGLAPFKLLHFRDGVNTTLGLPFRRTSPDHGTARDLAGQGVADAGSLRAALALARGIPL